MVLEQNALGLQITVHTHIVLFFVAYLEPFRYKH